MNILIVGSGGREHALAWKLRQSPNIKDIFIAPGNAGTATIGTNVPISTTEEIIRWLKKNPVNLVVIGPDNYLADGIVDTLQQLHITVFGPTKAAAQIEWSKVFAKQFMKEEGIPTATYEVFTDLGAAQAYIETQPFPLVIKANGLALGKGVIIAQNEQEASDALHNMMADKIFGEAGNEVVIEEYLYGTEISVHAFCDGESAILFPPAQDHKRIFDHDKGPNTGGMGTIAPVPGITQEQMKEIEEKVVKPTLNALKKRRAPFKGVLFPGIMLTSTGPKVIEFNARFGDPETQSYIRILETDLISILVACINGTLREQEVKWSKKSACCVVAASPGYPGKYEKGKIIKGLDTIQSEDVIVFHAGTTSEKNKIITNGGRVLGVTATSNTLKESLSKAYEALSSISFEGMQYRKDIGAKYQD